MADGAETKREKFVRLAEARTNSVLERIRILANCSNPYAYEYNEKDIEQIFSAIEKELKVAKSQFRTSQLANGKFEFRLGDREVAV